VADCPRSSYGKAGTFQALVHQHESVRVYLLPDKQVHERVKDKEDPRGSLFGMYLSWSRRVLGIGWNIGPWPEQGDENGDKAE